MADQKYPGNGPVRVIDLNSEEGLRLKQKLEAEASKDTKVVPPKAKPPEFWFTPFQMKHRKRKEAKG